MKESRIESVEQMETLMPLIKESLTAGQSVRFSPRGVSMLPMLRQGKDSVVLSPVSGQLRKYDLPLYQRDNGKYVLHRIVEAGNTYTCMGDNQFTPETNVRQDQMIAVVTAFYRGDALYSINEPLYHVYCRIWYHSRHFRHFWRRGIRWLQRLIHK